MLKQWFIWIFILLTVSTVKAQERYLDSLFSVEKSHKNLSYGQAEQLLIPIFENFTAKLKLTADIYQPVDDMKGDRPCIIFAHGGSFLVGSKSDYSVVKYAKEMASRGYVVMTINYRMGYNALDKQSAQRAVYRGVQDMKAAIRYVKEHAVELGVDPEMVIAAGNSAGGIMSLHTAYFDDTDATSIEAFFNEPYLECLSCSGNDYMQEDLPFAIANLWGGIADTTYIQGQNRIPVISYHGDDDKIVFINENSPHNLPTLPTLQGSNIVMERIHNLGITNEYYIFQDKGHEPWGLFAETIYFDFIVESSAAFFHKLIYAQENQ